MIEDQTTMWHSFLNSCEDEPAPHNKHHSEIPTNFQNVWKMLEKFGEWQTLRAQHPLTLRQMERKTTARVVHTRAVGNWLNWPFEPNAEKCFIHPAISDNVVLYSTMVAATTKHSHTHTHTSIDHLKTWLRVCPRSIRLLLLRPVATKWKTQTHFNLKANKHENAGRQKIIKTTK